MGAAMGPVFPGFGRSAIKRVAIGVASARGHGLAGIPAMVRARLSIAAGFGSPASLPASRHGSSPSRAKTDAGLRVIPLRSTPTAAKRNWSKPERFRANASELGMAGSSNTWSNTLVNMWSSALYIIRRRSEYNGTEPVIPIRNLQYLGGTICRPGVAKNIVTAQIGSRMEPVSKRRRLSGEKAGCRCVQGPGQGRHHRSDRSREFGFAARRVGRFSDDRHRRDGGKATRSG